MMPVKISPDTFGPNYGDVFKLDEISSPRMDFEKPICSLSCDMVCQVTYLQQDGIGDGVVLL